MRSKIDRVAGLLTVMTLGFVLFTAATGSMPIAAICALALGAMTVWAYKLLCARCAGKTARKRRARDARALVESWAVMPDEEALRAHLTARYGPLDCAVACVPLHSSGPALSPNEVFTHYRAHAGQDQLLIAVTGPVSPTARSAAQTLKEPVVRVLDGAALARIVASSDLPVPPAPETGRKAGAFLPRLAPDKKKAPRMAAYALLMLLIYLMSGQIVYLLLFMALTTLCAVSMRKADAPESLF